MKRLLLLLICFVPLVSFAQNFIAGGPVNSGPFVAGSSTVVTQTATLNYVNTHTFTVTLAFDARFSTAQTGGTTSANATVTVNQAIINSTGTATVTSNGMVDVSPGTNVTVKVTSTGSATPSAAGNVTVVGTFDAIGTGEPTLGSAAGTLFGTPQISRLLIRT